MNFIDGESVVVSNWGLGEVARRNSLATYDCDVKMIRFDIVAEKKRSRHQKGVYGPCVFVTFWAPGRFTRLWS